ncbi:hypothetical protein [Pedobacter faecalis]|uniref:hypothetical protein n=1 Tax=Pedobacter faecalis TaxID=3041495 RepID=UPI00254CF26C|nr:hypothetical protein [Pedobacter sp. ELA7]
MPPGRIQRTPAYDLTFSSGPNGEQSTMVMGEGRNPKITDLIKLGSDAKLSKSFVKETIDQTKDALNGWSTLAKNHHVAKANVDLVNKALTNPIYQNSSL